MKTQDSGAMGLGTFFSGSTVAERIPHNNETWITPRHRSQFGARGLFSRPLQIRACQSYSNFIGDCPTNWQRQINSRPKPRVLVCLTMSQTKYYVQSLVHARGLGRDQTNCRAGTPASNAESAPDWKGDWSESALFGREKLGQIHCESQQLFLWHKDGPFFSRLAKLQTPFRLG
ncbi:hypothetical protein BJY01DRAFT_103136 [Aspergillus pseudoustus]|uniref:Uncharacterized protein n=1 Tax=Aspergillus pseudoustus TaxID=1810923 RepID=A0ABR4KI57_9EURO